MNFDQLLSVVPDSWQPYVSLVAAIYVAVFVALPAALRPLVSIGAHIAGMTETPWDDEAVGKLAAFVRGLDWVHAKVSPLAPSMLAHPDRHSVGNGSGSSKPRPPSGPAVLAILAALAVSIAGCGNPVRTARQTIATGAHSVASLDAVLDAEIDMFQAEASMCIPEPAPEALASCISLIEKGERLRRAILAERTAAEALRSAEAAIDAWQDGADACDARAAIPSAMVALARLSSAISATGIDMPEHVKRIEEAAMALADLLPEVSGSCDEPSARLGAERGAA